MIMEKLKLDESEKDVFKTEVIQELKSQIGKEERKLQQVNDQLLSNVFLVYFEVILHEYLYKMDIQGISTLKSLIIIFGHF
jgi:hypothetical protein